MFVYTLNALLWNIVHRYMLKILNVDTIKKPSLRSEGLSGAYGSKPKIFKYNQLLSHFHK